MTNRKMMRFQERKDKIKCACGTQIPLLPDVKAKGEAIEVHIGLHLLGVQGQPCTTLEVDRLRDALIIQVLKVAGEFEGEETHG
jgi:hypothetical protein